MVIKTVQEWSIRAQTFPHLSGDGQYRAADVRSLIFAFLPELRLLGTCSLVCRGWRNSVRCIANLRLVDVPPAALKGLPLCCPALKELDITPRHCPRGTAAQVATYTALTFLGTMSSLERLSVSFACLEPFLMDAWSALPNLRSLRLSTCRDAAGLWCLPDRVLEVPIALARQLRTLDISWHRLSDGSLATLRQRAPQCRVHYHGRLLDAECHVMTVSPAPRRSLVLQEILTTEHDFLESCRTFVTLLSFFRDQGELSPELYDGLLGALPAVIAAGQKFYTEACGGPQALFSVFMHNEAYFRLLQLHSNSYESCRHLVEQLPDVGELFMARPEARGLSMYSFIIRPISRLCKYPLLLAAQELDKCATADSYPDREHAAAALALLTQLVHQANETRRERQRHNNLS